MTQGRDLAQSLFERVERRERDALPSAAREGLVSLASDALTAHKSSPVIRVEPVSETHTGAVVVARDKPFVVDSVLSAIGAAGGSDVDLVAHPVLDRDGKALSCVAVILSGAVAGPAGKRSRKALAGELKGVMRHVERTVADWKPMRAAVKHAADILEGADADEEAVAFLRWLLDDHFTLIGVRSYSFENEELSADGDVALGILRDPDLFVLTRGGEPVVMTLEVREFLLSDEPVLVTKANIRSVVHRRAHLDYVGVQRMRDGRVVGELRIVGLFTSAAYTRSVKTVPIMRRKADELVERWDTARGGHSAKALQNVIETWPRDEFFQASLDTLTAHTRAAVSLEERPRIRVLARADRFARFVSAMVYVPRELYDTTLRQRVGGLLSEAYEGRVSAWYPSFLESGLVRVQYILGRDGGEIPSPDPHWLEARITELSRSWSDRVQALARNALADDPATVELPHFPVGYSDTHSPDEALADIERLSAMQDGDELLVVFEITNADAGEVRLKLFHRNKPVPLSSRVPLLENMGFTAIEEDTHAIAQANGSTLYLHDMKLRGDVPGEADHADLETRLGDALLAIWEGRAVDDRFNSLVLSLEQSWRSASVWRAAALYLRQLRSRFTVSSMARTMLSHPHIALELVSAFRLRFDPAESDIEASDRALERVETMLRDVASSDDDRIIRNLAHVVRAVLRTNFYQERLWDPAKLPEDVPPLALAFKVDPSKIPLTPKPVPFREIFVSDPRVEGTHLRFGRVARGGLRWSDRAQDYRTEVLGLVKAQQVKNAVIVPVGSKGGFYPKKLPPRTDRDRWFEAGREAYRVFISSLLSVTDNLVDGEVVHPPRTETLDGEDPYFVVAADKGTATFSDTANAISRAYGFWLDDAFASGGSAGYDHKVMGITARGAWEAVKRHFREIGREGEDGTRRAWDIQTQAFTAAGVGDMSGDVFGNGMLLSEQTKLIAAFDHRDIFIDPNPDPAATYEERLRLFEMERSSWQNYDTARLSKGGMIVSRASKTIELTPEAAAAIGMETGEHPPEAILSAILKAPVDLMWFGGIGTYIKAAHESDAEVGDRANDAIRIDAREVRAKVIGEGANLGVTQAGRIAAALNGVHVNSDAIDNSGGVNSSDVEVNIKIALARAEAEGRLKRAKRNKLLASMTDAVADLVLGNNYEQTLAISLEERRGVAGLTAQSRFMEELEARDMLDRAVETLPNDAMLEERRLSDTGLTRPEIGVLLAYAKIAAFRDLVAAQDVSGVLDEPYFETLLLHYFPAKMRKSYAEDIRNHRLRHEIVATELANRIVGRGGPTFLSRVRAQTQGGIGEIARAFACAQASLDIDDLWSRIDALDTKVSGEVQLSLYAETAARLEETVLWFMRNTDRRAPVAKRVEAFAEPVAKLAPKMLPLAPDFVRRTVEDTEKRFAASGVPNDVASPVARLPVRALAPDVIWLANETGTKPLAAARTFFAVTKAFRVGRMVEAARRLSSDDWFDTLALDQALATIRLARRSIAQTILEDGSDVDAWEKRKGPLVARSKDQISAMLDGSLTVSRLSVAANLLGELARG